MLGMRFLMNDFLKSVYIIIAYNYNLIRPFGGVENRLTVSNAEG